MRQRLMPSAPHHLFQINDGLAAQHHAADHPIERAAWQHFILAARKHAGCMVQRVTSGFTVGDPGFEVVDAFGTHTEFDQIQGHVIVLSLPRLAAAPLAGKALIRGVHNRENSHVICRQSN
jgi:hypothetical protein